MKTSVKLLALSVSMIMGVVGGMVHGMERPLDEAASRYAYRDVPNVHVHHYPVVMRSVARLEARSESPQFLGTHVRLLSRLLDGDGNVVATGRVKGGGFFIEKTLSEGNYVLEVESQFLGASHENS